MRIQQTAISQQFTVNFVALLWQSVIDSKCLAMSEYGDDVTKCLQPALKSNNKAVGGQPATSFLNTLEN
jgi:hypothetical protein